MYNLETWKRRKKELKLTLEQIAEQTGISISTIKDIFRGATYAPRIDTVQAIEKVLKLDTSIWTPEDYSNGIQTTKLVHITPDEDDILYLYRRIGAQLGENGQKAFQEMGETLLKMKK